MPVRAVISRLLAIAALAVVAACGRADGSPTATSPGGSGEPTPTGTAGEQAALDGTSWLLSALNGAFIDLQEPITLSFSEGQARGFSGCNEYSGSYSAGADGNFSIPEIITTDRACETGMDLEPEYLAALRVVSHYRVIDGVRLELSTSNGETSLVYSLDEREALDGTARLAIEIGGVPPLAGTQLTMELRAGQVSGSTGCNEYHGSYAATGEGAFSITDLSYTERGCVEPEGIMEQEQAFIDALTRAASYELDVTDSHLRLLEEGGQTLAVFVNQKEMPGTGSLDGTGWVVTEMNGQQTSGETPITLMLISSQFSGRIGCISYAGAIQITLNGEIREMRPYSRGATACVDREAPESTADEYLSTLESATAYRLTPGRLELLDQRGEVVLAYRAGIPNGGELAGSAWKLISLDGAGLIAETEITLEFSATWLGGNSGCNNYGGQYMLIEQGVISIAEIASEAVGCTEPPGVIDQEVAYQNLLRQIVAYDLTGPRLELLDTVGDVRLVFERA